VPRATAQLYDWREVSLLTVGGRHREMISDGRLCSAGRDKDRGLDLQRTDWPAKRISPGNLTITYHATAPTRTATSSSTSPSGLEYQPAVELVGSGQHQNVHEATRPSTRAPVLAAAIEATQSSEMDAMARPSHRPSG